jgi:TetR/AcrR family fatty acid metabolism transcriptional regulator
MSPSVRRALVAERESQILGAAAKVFGAKGYERATIADIAKEAGISEGSIYNYFKNKGDLLVSLPYRVINPQIESLGALAGDRTPEEALSTIARTMTATIRQNAHIFRILLSALPGMTQKMREQYLHQVVLNAGGIIQIYFEEQIRRGVFRQDLPPSTLALAFIGMFFPTILIEEVMQIEIPSPRDYEEIISTSVQVFLQGALAGPAAARPARKIANKGLPTPTRKGQRDNR